MTATQIKASDVQKLRQSTGAGLMDCKKALVDSNGDFDKAVKLLRERGIAKSSKRSDKTAAEGKVTFWISDDKKSGIIFELNCETDFVAKNEEFQSLSDKLVKFIKDNPNVTKAEELPTEDIQALSGKIGEKIEAKRFERLKSEKGLIHGYIHMGAKLGVLIQLDSDKDISGEAGAQELAQELAFQIAGADPSPSYVNKDEVPQDVIQQEKEITMKQMEGMKKPPEILEKIATGKLQQYYSLHCLMEQAHVRDTSGKTKISAVVDQAAKKIGAKITVAKFVRYRVGAA